MMGWRFESLPDTTSDLEVLLIDDSIVVGFVDVHCACSDVPATCEPVFITDDARSDKNGVLDDRRIKAWRFR